MNLKDVNPAINRPTLALALALAPALAAVWCHPGFVTQDGPAHHYNAHILARSFDPSSPFLPYFQARWEPLPNWAGHLAWMTADRLFPPRVADRAITTLTLTGFALAVFRLRLRVAGKEGATVAAVLGALLGLNVTWLLGFTSFLLGASLFPVTLGVWWRGRDQGGSARNAGKLAGLVTVGYFCHPVSLGLTAFGLCVLEALTPGRDRLRRAGWTALGLAPMIPLGLIYLGLSRRGGGFSPEWKHLVDPLSVRSWVNQLTWVDPISLSRKDYLPIARAVARGHLAVAPVLWLGVAVFMTMVGRRGLLADPERRGWWVLALLLLAAGVAGPDTLGANHGEYLQQRIVLLGLVALTPVLRFDRKRVGKVSAVALTVALVVQSAIVWDYAETSEQNAGAVLRAGPAVGQNQRIATRLTGIRTPFRANPLLHADCALGVGTGNIVWSDYETRFYYFPVQFRPGLDRPDPAILERIALSAVDDADRGALWKTLLEEHQDAIDLVLTWGADPALDAENARWFRPEALPGGVTLWKRRREVARD